MASPISKILKSFSKNFGTFAAGMSAWMMANLHGDDDVEGKVDAMWKAMGVGAYVGDAVRNSMLSAYEKGTKKSISLLPSALEQAWDESGMTLSEKLHGADKEMRDRIVQTIREQLKLNHHAMTAARELYDGYNSGKSVTRRQSIPKYLQKVIDFARRSDLTKEDEAYLLRMVRRAQRQVDKLAADGAPNRALKSAYSELLTAVSERSEKAMQRAVHTAIEEKSRYIAERIARTEAARAWADGFVERYGHDESVVAYQWKLSSRHPKFDICNLYADANLWGLGNGIYPKDETPKLPVHPHCLCHLAPVFSSELEGKTAKNRIEGGGRQWLFQQSAHHRQQILGVQGNKAVMNQDSWTRWARCYSGEKLQSRVKDLPESLKPYLKNGKIKIEDVAKRIAGEEDGVFEKRIRDYIKSDYCTKDFTDRQRIHIKGTDIYAPGKSYYPDPEAMFALNIQKLLLDGKIKLTNAGDWDKKILIHHSGVMGIVVHKDGGEVSSEYSFVHIGDKGIHLVPKGVETDGNG
ncbi:polymorphic toxin type 50 domain-containing protein [Selenomonas ruminantium]|uniref:polymorphic toxin type 50 domain-containing protein n=1 Tax=Selenomonas ruminantium TaxID=971 RepID=UPI00041DDA5E|nr:polymorphic toxin type 50 domain-containing protein [Selenomonas ruminantium]